MKIKLDQDFVDIAKDILSENKTLEEWAEIESDDVFQKGAFIGGFDATEEEFCFSYEVEEEYWFQLPLEDIEKVVKREITEIEGDLAD